MRQTAESATRRFVCDLGDRHSTSSPRELVARTRERVDPGRVGCLAGRSTRPKGGSAPFAVRMGIAPLGRRSLLVSAWAGIGSWCRIMARDLDRGS